MREEEREGERESKHEEERKRLGKREKRRDERGRERGRKRKGKVVSEIDCEIEGKKRRKGGLQHIELEREKVKNRIAISLSPNYSPRKYWTLLKIIEREHLFNDQN